MTCVNGRGHREVTRCQLYASFARKQTSLQTHLAYLALARVTRQHIYIIYVSTFSGLHLSLSVCD